MWIFCGSNWLHIKHAIFWPLHLSSCLSWSDQCTSSAKASVTFFRLVMVCGLGKFHQIHRVLWKISWFHLSWWWASLPILTDLPPRYANAEKIMVEESTYTLFSPSQIEGHFPPVDLGILPYPPSNWKKKTNRGRQVFPLPVDLLRWSPAESLLDYNYPQKKTSKFNDHGNLVHSQHPQAVPPGHLFLQCGQIRVFRGRQRATMRRGGDAQGAQLGVLTRRPVETIGFPIYYKYTNPIGDCRITIFVAGKLKPEPRNSGVVEKDWDLHLEVFCFALVTLAPPTPWPSSAQVVDLAPWPGPKSLPPTGQFSLPPTGRFTWFWLQP